MELLGAEYNNQEQVKSVEVDEEKIAELQQETGEGENIHNQNLKSPRITKSRVGTRKRPIYMSEDDRDYNNYTGLLCVAYTAHERVLEDR